MKKFTIHFLAFILFGTFAFAQTKKAAPVKTKNTDSTQVQTPKDTIPLEVKIYSTATYFSDYEVAKYAVYSLICKYPQRLDYLDTLARIYFTTGNYMQSIAASNVVLMNQPDNFQLMELAAVSQNALNNHKESLALYEKLYAHTKQLDHLYQLAIQQYSLQRYGECQASIEKILADSASLKEKISFSYDEKTSQDVPYAAATYNLRGVIEKEVSQKDKAVADFEAALKIFPEFKLAKSNLEQINKPGAPIEKEKKKK